jgi:hypothetical protein
MSKKSRERKNQKRAAERNAVTEAARAAWLSQFKDIPASELNAEQQKYWYDIRNLFPKAKLARRTDGRLSYYFVDAEDGGSAGDFPEYLET